MTEKLKIMQIEILYLDLMNKSHHALEKLYTVNYKEKKESYNNLILVISICK